MEELRQTIVNLHKIKVLTEELHPYKRLKFYELFNPFFDKKGYNSTEINNAVIFMNIAIEKLRLIGKFQKEVVHIKGKNPTYWERYALKNKVQRLIISIQHVEGELSTVEGYNISKVFVDFYDIEKWLKAELERIEKSK